MLSWKCFGEVIYDVLRHMEFKTCRRAPSQNLDYYRRNMIDNDIYDVEDNEYQLIKKACNKAISVVQKERKANKVPQTHPFRVVSEMERYVELVKMYLEKTRH